MDQRLLNAFADGELEPEEAARVVMHLADCPEDQALVDAIMMMNVLLVRACAGPLEEPVPPDMPEVMAQVASGTSIPIATGERLTTKWEFARIIENRAASILQPDLGRSGGILETKKIAAMAAHDRLPMPFERARTQLLLGLLQRRQRQKERSRATLRDTLQDFEKMGAQLWADRVRTELARAEAIPTHGHSLTPSERRVAELAANGMTNKDVAAALFISPKTVESNLGRIYRKLGINSRAELGRVIDDL